MIRTPPIPFNARRMSTLFKPLLEQDLLDRDCRGFVQARPRQPEEARHRMSASPNHRSEDVTRACVEDGAPLLDRAVAVSNGLHGQRRRGLRRCAELTFRGLPETDLTIDDLAVDAMCEGLVGV